MFPPGTEDGRQGRAVRLRFGNAAPSAKGTGAGRADVPGNLHRNLGQVNDLPGSLDPTPRQPGATAGTLLQHVFHPLRGRHAGPGKAVRPELARFPGLGRFPVLFGLQPGHPPRALALGWPFPLGNPLLRPLDDGLLPDGDANQIIPAGGSEIDLPFHSFYMT